MSDPVLSVDNLRAYYDTKKGPVKALDGVTFSIGRGEIFGVAGESGSGKTTLAYALILREPPLRHVAGKAFLNGRNLIETGEREMRRIRYREIALIPQAAMNSFSPTRRIDKLIFDLMKERHINTDKIFLQKLRKRFALVNLDERVLTTYPPELSGGMKQRLVMVISTLLDPSLLIADEITSALDVTSQRLVLDMLQKKRDEKIVGSVLYITHDLAVLSQVADRIMIMYAGQTAEIGTADDIMKTPLHPYTRALVTSLPGPEDRFQDRKISGIGGAPPELLAIGPGCRFRFRCPHASPVCGRQDPLTEDAGQGRVVLCHHWRSVREI